MTAPNENPPADETPEGSGETGALAAASEDHDGGDPLAPLNALTEDED